MKNSTVCSRMAAAVMLLMVTLMAASSALSQGTLTFSNMPPNAPNSSGAGSGGTGASCDIVCGPSTPITLFRVGTVPATAGTYTVIVSTRPGGAFTVNPPTAASQLQTTGWTNHGSASVTFANNTVPTQIPVNINVTVQPNARLGVAIVLVAGNYRYTSSASLPSPAITANNDLAIHWAGIAGSYSTVVGGPSHVGSFAPRGPVLSVWYDLAQVQGPSAQVSTVGVSTTLPQVGANTVDISIRNNGTTDLSNTPLTVEYSTNAGSTWVGTTTITPPSFLPLAFVNHTFALPWAIAAIGPQTLWARISSTVGSSSPNAVATFTPNAEITSIVTTPANPVMAPNTVAFTLRNNGTFNLNGVPLSMRYTTDGGTTFVTQQFTPTTLGTANATETFTFTTPWLLSAVAPATLTVDMFPSIGAAAISRTNSYPSAGQLISTHTFAPGPNGGANTFPFGQPICKKQIHYTPAQMANLAGPITQFAVMMSAAFTNVTWPDVRIEMGESTLSGSTLTTSFDGNYNVPSRPKTIVYNGPLTLTNPAANDYANIILTTPYDYSGQNDLVVTIFVNGASSTTALGYLVPSSISTNYRLYANAAGDAATGTLGSTWALNARFVFQLGVSGSSLRVIDVGHNDVNQAATVGSLPVKVKIKNNGTFNFTGQPLGLEYSINGGTSWVPQTFTPTALYSLFEETFTFTTPWVVAGVGAESLSVRIPPPGIGTVDQLRTETYVPDIDVTGLSTTPVLPIAGPNTITATLKNNGTFNLAGQSVTLRYTTDGGITYVTQTFPLTTAAAPNGTEVVSFTTAWSPNLGNHTVTVDMPTAFNGDPDAVNLYTRQYNGVGYSVAEPNTTQTEVPSHTQPNTGSGYPVNTWWHDNRLECTYLASELAAAGMSAGSAIAQIQLRCSDLPLMEYQNFRVQMQLTTASAPGTSFTSTGWETVFGPQTLPISFFSVGEWFSLPLVPNFVWDGTSNLLVNFVNDANNYVGNGGVFLRQYTTERARIGYDDSGSTYPFDTIANQSNVLFIPSIRFFHGAGLVVSDLNLEVNYLRPNGVKDAYRGESLNLKVEVNNPRSFAMNLTGFTLSAVDANGVPVPGISLTLPTFPIAMPANTPATLNIPCVISPSAAGINGERIFIRMFNAAAVDPAAPVTNPVVVGVLDSNEFFDLYNGPAPAQLVITTSAFNPVVETVPFLQNLNVTGGTGSYTWSIPTSSPNQLPNGLSLDPQGSAFLPAKISGTPALGTAILGPYSILLSVSDGAYVRNVTLTMTVVALSPLQFPPVTLAGGQEYVAYTMTTPFTATGGSLIYNFGVDPSSVDPLPTGLTLNPQTGVISGIPADGTQRTYSITFLVDDGQSQLTQIQSLVISPHPLQWRGTTLPTATQTVVYNESLDAIGGTGPRIYSIVSGTLPNGLSLNASTGVINGIPSLTPSSVGTYNMVFKVTDGQNASVNQAITITVVVAPPLQVTSNLLPYGQVGAAYNGTVAITGGSQAYLVTVASSSAATLPSGLTLASNGEVTGTPDVGADGRYDLTLSVDDGFQSITHTVTLAIVDRHTENLAITEVDTGTGYIELALSGQEPVDVSGWTLRVWVDGTSPVNLPMDSLPGASLMLPGEIVSVAIGGTAGGTWPSFSTGGSWTATGTSSLAVQLLDIHGSTIDFAAFGTVTTTALVDGANVSIELPGALASMAPAANGSANYSLASTGWVGSAAGTPGAQNPGLPLAALTLIKDEVHAARQGDFYRDWVIASGGKAPYTYGLNAPTASWLSINSTTGELSGTAGNPGAVSMDINITDANSIMITRTVTLFVFGSTTSAAATFAVGTGESQSFEGSVVDVPVTMTKAATASDVQGFDFVIELPTATAAELDMVRVLPGPALLASGYGIVARDMGNNRIFVGSIEGLGAPSSTGVGNGVVAIVRMVVPADNNVMAPEATYPVNISQAGVYNNSFSGVALADGTNGAAVLSNYKPQDVNRDTAIDVVDVQQTVNIILSLFTPTYAGQGDANSDNAVDVVDVQTIVNCILLGGC